MVSGRFVVQNEKGFHLRIAGLFCEKAMKYSCKVEIKKGEKCLNGKSVLGVLGVGIRYQDEVEILCTGLGEQEALEELLQYVQKELVEADQIEK